MSPIKLFLLACILAASPVLCQVDSALELNRPLLYVQQVLPELKLECIVDTLDKSFSLDFFKVYFQCSALNFWQIVKPLIQQVVKTKSNEVFSYLSYGATQIG